MSDVRELDARSKAEALLYLELLSPGEERVDPSRFTSVEEDPESGPGALRLRCELPEGEYVFRLPALSGDPEPPEAVDYGPGRSELLDPLDWFTVEAGYAQGGAGAIRALAESGEVPGGGGGAAVVQMLRIAGGAARQLARFLPEGTDPTDVIPADAFRTEEGSRLKDSDTWPFERARIEQATKDYASLLNEFTRTTETL